jgi:hypothetical protein
MGEAGKAIVETLIAVVVVTLLVVGAGLLAIVVGG